MTRQKRVAELLLQGCENKEIAKQLNIPVRTIKADMSRLFVSNGITDGYKRVKLAVVLYRRQLCQRKNY
jgi:DNA-binding NarL/FixJ family response regulator